jgi:hypothetical protein
MVEAKVRPLIVVTTAPWLPERAHLVERLRAELEPQCKALGLTTIFHEGTDRTSHIPNYTAAIQKGIDVARLSGATHITLLPDDAILVPHFVEVLSRLIAHRPDDHMCLLTNHRHARKAYDEGAGGYYTVGGTVLFGGTMRVPDWESYLAWRRDAIKPGEVVPFDNGVNLWDILHDRQTWKPLPALVEHDTTLESTLGNNWQDSTEAGRTVRHSQVWYPEADLRGRDWREPPNPDSACHTVAGQSAYLGRTFAGQHWDIAKKLRPHQWNIEAMYEAERGEAVSDEPHLMVVVPMFGEPAIILTQTDPSRQRAYEHLREAGVKLRIVRSPGDSLVQRMRQRVMHQFLKSPCTHLLWWDADIELLTPSVVTEMLSTGHDLIAGAYPFKDKTGRTVCNIWEKDYEAGRLEIAGGCLEVQDAGTGFMLVSRRVHTLLAMQHPELMHLSMDDAERDEPLWALYDTSIDGGRYLSEDYQLCRLWQRSGGKVYVYVPAKFRHWGVYGYEGSIEQQWGFNVIERRPMTDVPPASHR